MDLFAPDRKLREALEDLACAKRHYGQAMAKKLHLRRDALRAAESLADFWPPKKKPERVHELMGDLKGIFSIDLKQPYRLLFKPIEVVAQPTHTEREQTSPDSGVGTATSKQTHELSAQEKASDDELKRWKAIKTVELLRIEDTHD